MVRLILLLALAGVALIFWYKLKTAPPAKRKKLLFTAIATALGLVLLLLAVTGHLNLITAAIAGLFAAAPRLLHYARYLPLLQRLFQGRKPHDPAGQPPPSAGDAMSHQQALDILGLQPGASREAILRAHKRMMQKVHPDRGGSDYMAAQINQAKKTLLG